MTIDTSPSAPNSATPQLPLKAAVIGAGVSGLSAAAALKTEGHQVVVYEKSNRLGGTWVYDPRSESDPLGVDPNRQIIHGSLYRSLRTNIPRQLMGFSDHPFPTTITPDPRTFPGHEEVLRFLDEFARDHELDPLIRFGSEVVRVEPDSGNWIVESTRNESSSTEVFDAIVVCSGHHTISRIAHFQGNEKWPGKQMHSHNYRVPEPFRDQIVVVIGRGPSARDISLEISNVAKEVHLSLRSPIPNKCGDNMWEHSMIDHVDESGEVKFQDGTFVHADIILHCTGYNYSFPFLKTEGIVTVDDNRVGPLYKHVFPPSLAPSLSFIGIPYNSGVVFMMIDLQAKWIARVLSGKASLPSEDEMMFEVEAYYKYLDEGGIPKHHTHSLVHKDKSTTAKLEYLDWLARQVGLDGVDEETRLVQESYYKFMAEKGEAGRWNKRDWEIGNGVEEECVDFSKERLKLNENLGSLNFSHLFSG